MQHFQKHVGTHDAQMAGLKGCWHLYRGLINIIREERLNFSV